VGGRDPGAAAPARGRRGGRRDGGGRVPHRRMCVDRGSNAGPSLI
jgi:hypothetical protein